jgi:putative tricarboxylic transport membrane protein
VRSTPRLLLAAFLVALPPARTYAQPMQEGVRIMAPAAPGGGRDQTARVMQQVLRQTGLVRTVTVENVPGAAGTIGLARFIGAEPGRTDALMISGLIMLGAIAMQRSPVTLGDVTPIARLTGEYEAIVVPATSPYRSLRDLLDDFRTRPEAIAWGGGSAGGSDQILAGLVATAAGVAPRRVNYIAFSGGGESLSAIVGGQVSVGVNGLAELAAHIESGAVRALAVSSAERLVGLDIPTLREQGIDVEFENWRSVVAPPGLSVAARRQLEALVAAMVRSDEWRQALERYRWIDRYLAGDAFARYVQTEEARVRGILRELGTIREDSSAPGPYPLLVVSGLMLCALAAVVERMRTRRQRPRPVVQRRSLARVAVAGTVFLAFADVAGFIVAAAALFWLTAQAFDRQHPLRDGVYAVAVAAAAYLLFAGMLDLTLPRGALERWL